MSAFFISDSHRGVQNIDLRILFDASSFLNRAFRALPDLRAPDQLPTGAIFGVANMLRRLMKDYPSEEIVVVFDAPGGTFRHRLYPQYKAQRPAMPDDLCAQIPLLHEWIQASGLPLLLVPDVEAGDVIGTLARQAEPGQKVIIVTGDKDMDQLVNDHVTLLDTMKGVTTDMTGVRERYGVAPQHLADLLALTGDKIDNIPGVPGVGPKTAAKWIQQYGSLDGVLAHADAIGGKIGEVLRASLEVLPLSLELATIRCNLDLPDQSWKRSSENTQKLKSLAKRLGFHGWLRTLTNTENALLYAPEKASQCTSSAWMWANRQNGDYPEHTENGGKWLIFVDSKNVDEVWDKIKIATQNGKLGGSAKVATARAAEFGKFSTRLICVYTYDWTDENDVIRIRDSLRQIGITAKISYKTDQDTRSGVYSDTVSRRISKYYE